MCPGADGFLKGPCAQVRESGLQEELRDRQYHQNKSQRRFEREKAAFNRSMGKVIRERLVWLQRRKRIK